MLTNFKISNDVLQEVQDIEKSCRKQLDSLQAMNDDLQQNMNFLKCQNAEQKLTIRQLTSTCQRQTQDITTQKEFITNLTEENLFLVNEIKLLNEQLNHDKTMRNPLLIKNQGNPINPDLVGLKNAVQVEKNRSNTLKQEISDMRIRIETQKSNTGKNKENSKLIQQSLTESRIENTLKRVVEVQENQDKQNSKFIQQVLELMSSQKSLPAKKIQPVTDVISNGTKATCSMKKIMPRDHASHPVVVLPGKRSQTKLKNCPKQLTRPTKN